MKLFAHLVVSLALTVILYPFFGSYSLLVLLTGFFIDIDHYPAYIFKTGDFNFFKANNYFLKKKLRNILCIFHTVEFMVFVIVLSFFSASGFILLVGLTTHHIMDFYNELKLNRLDAKVKSLTLYLLRWLK